MSGDSQDYDPQSSRTSVRSKPIDTRRQSLGIDGLKGLSKDQLARMCQMASILNQHDDDVILRTLATLQNHDGKGCPTCGADIGAAATSRTSSKHHNHNHSHHRHRHRRTRSRSASNGRSSVPSAHELAALRAELEDLTSSAGGDDDLGGERRYDEVASVPPADHHHHRHHHHHPPKETAARGAQQQQQEQHRRSHGGGGGGRSAAPRAKAASTDSFARSFVSEWRRQTASMGSDSLLSRVPHSQLGREARVSEASPWGDRPPPEHPHPIRSLGSRGGSLRRPSSEAYGGGSSYY